MSVNGVFRRTGAALALGFVLGSGCSSGDELPPGAPPSAANLAARAHAAGIAGPSPVGTNVLIVVIDDLGADQVQVYHPEATNLPPTPNITALAQTGVRFERAYAFPTCSPARGALLTGRYPSRTGVGVWMDLAEEQFALPLSELTIPEMLDQGGTFNYSNAFFGKWHLTGSAYASPAHHPLDQGFDWFEGTLDNLGGALVADGRKRDYYHWEKDTNGSLAYVDEYATTKVINDALAKIPELPEPWFVEVALHAPHVPFHKPPPELHTQPLPAECGMNVHACWRAAVEAMDTELGRFVATLGPDLLSRTTFIVTADNGSIEEAILPPFDNQRDKGTVYDGGTRIPFIVNAPWVTQPGAVSDALINFVDVFPTVAEIADVDVTTLRRHPVRPGGVELDGTSLLDAIMDPTAPQRDTVYSQWFRPNGRPPYQTQEWMVRNDTHKVIRAAGEHDQLFQYGNRSWDEGLDEFAQGALDPEDQAAYDSLSATLDTIIATTPYEGH